MPSSLHVVLSQFSHINLPFNSFPRCQQGTVWVKTVFLWSYVLDVRSETVSYKLCSVVTEKTLENLWTTRDSTALELFSQRTDARNWNSITLATSLENLKNRGNTVLGDRQEREGRQEVNNNVSHISMDRIWVSWESMMDREAPGVL